MWFTLTLWTTVSLSTNAADALGVFDWLPGVAWVRALGTMWLIVSGPLVVARSLWCKSEQVNPERRMLLQAGACAALVPVAGLAFAIRKSHREAAVREVELAIPSLPADLDGFRLVQISDIHLGPFFSRQQLRRVVDQANELRACIALMTGDLITSYDDPLEDALAEIARLRTTAGVYGCLGNHEIVAQAEDKAEWLAARLGIHILRSRAETLSFGSARLNLAGVDYQRKGTPYLIGTETLLDKGACNLLLSHNPDVFPVAAEQGWDVTLAGHTHGGQITLEYLHPSLNPARFYTPFTYGSYRTGKQSMFVTSGLGTVGLPARLGTHPEIALIRLRLDVSR